MNNVINNIMNQLNNVFVELDEVVLEQSKKWALERKGSIFEFLKSNEAKAMDSVSRYLKAFDVAGGKSWYTLFTQNSDEDILAFIEKNCKTIANKRNVSISKKLEKAEVTEVIESQIVKTTDGFNGLFMINTNKGSKKVTIETIYSGGYNIQCLHLRTLVKIK